ncbi:hypothetical protein [Bacteroides sp. OF04-15BH]|uniref:hypothetical protein n=1 Tax=Bacteroides sp. OF04-15BH TaxID=2292281 RepID=UPI000E48AE0A|nr:hypothetical protein [Bacteroides sp. OF04-15BH]RHP65260.1 hypothetical protein DXA74_06640 [Bacteroides sp. OF04-15BH]
MKSSRKILYSLLLAGAQILPATAQTNGTNSPYSRFGLGMLDDQSQGFNKAMSGLGIGLHAGNRVNMLNPASYSKADSLTFIFDVGMSLQNGNFSDGSTSVNAHNTSLDYVNALFRIRKHLGFSFGFVPYSSIGYNFTTSQHVGTDYVSGNTITNQSTYYGDGGIHQLYAGIGWEPFRNFSIGANVSYLWGNYYHTVSQTLYNGSSADANANNLYRQFNADITTYKVDLGVQYDIPINKKNLLTIGAIAGIGHKINNSATVLTHTTNSDSTTQVAPNAFQLPYSFGVGINWKYNNQWSVGADVHHEKWADCVMPAIDDQTSVYAAQKGQFLNRTKAVIGAEFVPNRESRRYLQRVEYKIGASYSTPYVKVNGQDGPREYGITAGFGLPITNNINNRSVVNVSFQWLHCSPSATSMITENYLRLNVGITFNEKWFMKWKIN